MHSRENVKLGIVAVFCITVSLVAPASADAVRRALNADTVDGKSAVSAGASTNARKGKLVATQTSNGKLPNSIIAKAGNANKLDGRDSTAFQGRVSYASVTGAGNLFGENAGVVSATRFSTGIFDVVFDSDVADCAHIATPLDSTAIVKYAIAGPRYTSAGEPRKYVRVNMQNLAGTASNGAFSLAVIC